MTSGSRVALAVGSGGYTRSNTQAAMLFFSDHYYMADFLASFAMLSFPFLGAEIKTNLGLRVSALGRLLLLLAGGFGSSEI